MANESAWFWTTDVRLASSRAAIHELLTELLAALENSGWEQHDVFGVHLAMEEALVNAIRHGNGWDERKRVHVVCKLSPDRLSIEIADEGHGFNPEHVPDCTDGQNLQRPGGRGIMLMRSYMSRVEYSDGGHRVLMEKSRRAQATPPVAEDKATPP